MTTQNTVPLDAAARRLQTTPLNILMHIKRGLLKATESPDGWLIDAGSLHNYILTHGDRKATDICRSHCSNTHGCGGGC